MVLIVIALHSTVEIRNKATETDVTLQQALQKMIDQLNEQDITAQNTVIKRLHEPKQKSSYSSHSARKESNSKAKSKPKRSESELFLWQVFSTHWHLSCKRKRVLQAHGSYS